MNSTFDTKYLENFIQQSIETLMTCSGNKHIFLDFYSLKRFDFVFHFEYLRKLGVTKIIHFDTIMKARFNCDFFIFIYPNLNNLILIKEYLSTIQENSNFEMRIIFCSNISANLLKMYLECAESYKNIKIVINKIVMNLSIRDKRLICIEDQKSEIYDYVYDSSEEMLKSISENVKFIRNLYDLKPSNIITFGKKSQEVSKYIDNEKGSDKIIIIDRSIDFLSVMRIQTTYLGIITEIFGDVQVLKIKNRVIPLSGQVYNVMKNLEFEEAKVYVTKKCKRIKNILEKFNNLEKSDPEYVKNCKKVVKYLKLKPEIENQLLLANFLNKKIISNNIANRYACEEKVMEGEYCSPTILENDYIGILRLFSFLNFKNEGVDESYIEKIRPKYDKEISLLKKHGLILIKKKFNLYNIFERYFIKKTKMFDIVEKNKGDRTLLVVIGGITPFELSDLSCIDNLLIMTTSIINGSMLIESLV